MQTIANKLTMDNQWVDQLYFGRETIQSLEHDIDFLTNYINTANGLDLKFCIAILKGKGALYEQEVYQQKNRR